MVNKPKVCIMTGEGLGFESRTKYAFDLAGADSEIVHLNDLIEGRKNLKDYQILAIPGGFSFGDDISAGKILAVKLTTNLGSEINQFISEGKLIIGIGNGFQALLKSGVLSFNDLSLSFTLSRNSSGKFENRWVRLALNQKSPCIFTKGVGAISLPVMHSEGRFVAKDSAAIKNLEKNNLVVFRYADEKDRPSSKYPENPNGSVNNIAGVCDKTGRIFGLMAHPEMNISSSDNPELTGLKKIPTEGDGLKIFKNAVNYANSKLVRR